MVLHEPHRERGDLKFKIGFDKSFRVHKEACVTSLRLADAAAADNRYDRLLSL